MRRDHFLKSLAALAAAGAYPLSAHAGANLKMMIPANPGGGWDGTGRELGKALLDAKVADTVQYENKGGAAGVIGLAQFVNAAKGDGNALIMTGAVMPAGLDTVVPQELCELRGGAGGPAGGVQRGRFERTILVAAGKQPALGASEPPVAAQNPQELRRQHDIAAR